MTPSHQLHQLIHSLNKSEKIWFTLHAKPGSDYQRLFEAIRLQKTYDEKRIKQFFNNDPLLKRLSAVKNYLYEFILQCLFFRHEKNDLDTQFLIQLGFCEFLIEKNLLKSALKRIQKIKKQSLDNDQFLFSLQAIRIEINILYLRNAKGDHLKVMQLYDEEERVMKIYENLKRYSRLDFRLSLFRRKIFISRRNSDHNYYKKLLLDPLLKNENLALSRSAKFYYNCTKAECLSQLNNHKLALKFQEQSVQLYENLQILNANLVMRYVLSLQVFANGLFYAGQITKCLAITKRISAIELEYSRFLSEKRRADLFIYCSISELHVLYHSGNFDLGVKRLEESIEKLHKSRLRYISLGDQVALNYNSALIYYGANQLRKSLRKINAIINEHEEHIGRDVVCFAHILRLIIHIDLGNDDLISSIAKSTAHYLRRRKRLFKIETLFLNFSKQLSSAKYGSKVELLKRLKVQFDMIYTLNFEKKILEYFDFSAWFISRIERRPFAVVFKELRNK